MTFTFVTFPIDTADGAALRAAWRPAGLADLGQARQLSRRNVLEAAR
ncbi:hypothetical protein [uncultured Enterovirga sp.]